jgi:hypothetical protein
MNTSDIGVPMPLTSTTVGRRSSVDEPGAAKR